MTPMRPMLPKERTYGERLNTKRPPADTREAGCAPMVLQMQKDGSGPAELRERT